MIRTSFRSVSNLSGIECRAVILGMLIALIHGTVASAAISHVNKFRAGAYQQNGNGNSLINSGFYSAAGLYSTGANEFASASLSYPGPATPAILAATVDPLFLIHYSALFPDQASMDVAYPTGAYQFDAGAFSTTINYLSDAFPLTRPYLDGTDYANLQGMNPAADFQFHFSPYNPGGQADQSNIFFSIFDDTLNASVYNANFLPSSTSGLTLPANTLTFGHNYRYELIFDNRELVPSPGALFDAQLGFDYRTQGSFSTSVPEPTSMLLLGSAGIGWSLIARRGIGKGDRNR